MSMTVKQMIKLLRKMDPDALVAWSAHDQSNDEIDGWVNFVEEAEPCLLEVEGKDKIVVIRP